MTVDLSNANVRAVFGRAGMLPTPPAPVLAQLHAACEGVDGYTDAVLDVSRAHWGTETDQADVLVVLMREAVVLVRMRKRGMFKAPEPSAMTMPFSRYSDVADDDDFIKNSVWFLARDPVEPFLLTFADAEERHRMWRAMRSAHLKDYSQWGLQLDPANFVADFDRYYAEIVAEGPAESSGTEWLEWIEARYGEFDLRNALSLAADWRERELDDAANPGGYSNRVGRLKTQSPWIEQGPEACRVFVRLGAQLFDAGLLGPPYDERTYDTGEPITQSDAGPARLAALMTLAANAKAVGDPRADEWIRAARAGIPAVPSTTFPRSLLTLWSGVE